MFEKFIYNFQTFEHFKKKRNNFLKHFKILRIYNQDEILWTFNSKNEPTKLQQNHNRCHYI